VTTAASVTIDSRNGSSGIAAVNKAPAPAGSPFVIPSTSHISVLAYGIIESGTLVGGSGDPAAGIVAGYNPGLADTADDNVHGNVYINDYASILAATGTDGIRAVNYGTGLISIITEAGANITTSQGDGLFGIAALGADGGDITITTYATLNGFSAAIDATTTSTGTVVIDNYGTMTGDVLSANATFDNESGGIWNLAGTSTFATGANSIINDGTINTTATSSIISAGTLSVTNAGTVNVQSGSLDVAGAVTGAGQFTIAGGAQLEFGASVGAGETVTFLGSTGTLKLDDATHFAGQVVGLTGSDGIDLAGFDAAHAVVTPVTSITETVLTVTDENHTVANGTAAVLTLLGNYTSSSFNLSDDTHGGVLIVDPPLSGTTKTTVAATAPDQTLVGVGSAGENFAFNFANVGQASVANFHADRDVVQLNASTFNSVQALLDATHDDGHGNTVITLDAHDSITLSEVAKAQLSQSDFHFV
jgi:large repetitive protein